MKKHRWPYRLMAPGPVPVPPAVLELMNDRVLHHRTPRFEQFLHQAWDGLKQIFGTKQPVMILAGTGSAAMEAALLNTLSPGDEVLAIVSGKFGERWADMCDRYCVNAHRWQIPWGEPAQPEALSTKLRKHKNLKAVLMQACETSTATLHPVAELTKVIRQHHPQALVMVDAITAMACTPLAMDQLDLDVVVAGSQKAFMIPTGLSFIALSERAWQEQAKTHLPCYYFDLALERAANSKGETHFSTPTPLVVGLSVVINRMLQVGLDRVRARVDLLAQVTREYGPRLGFGIYSKSPSPTVTALTVPTGCDSAVLRQTLEKEYNLVLMGGQDQAKGKILRVGHMGDIQSEDMTALFLALSEQMELITGNKCTLEFKKFETELEEKLKTVEPLFP